MTEKGIDCKFKPCCTDCLWRKDCKNPYRCAGTPDTCGLSNIKKQEENGKRGRNMLNEVTERNALKCITGILKTLDEYSPVKAAFKGVVELAENNLAAKRLRSFPTEIEKLKQELTTAPDAEKEEPKGKVYG